MSMTEKKWQPGDVALVETPRTSFAAWKRSGDDLWVDEEGVEFSTSSPIRGDWTLRPLVVIDPEDREQLDALTKAIVEACYADGNVVVAGNGIHPDTVQRALREFANPTPPIEEPTGWLAAVIDDVGDKWVRDGMAGDRSQSGHWWNHTIAAEKNYDGTLRADWHAIRVVRVLSEGVPAEVTP